MKLIGIASVLTIIVVFALMAGCRTKTEAETIQQNEFFTDRPSADGQSPKQAP